MVAYSAEIERHMKALFNSLSEQDRRRYAAVEAEKLGQEGVQYVARLFECDDSLIREGLADIWQVSTGDANASEPVLAIDNARLLKLSEKRQPPTEWFERDEEDLF
jgi:hypothetical protein